MAEIQVENLTVQYPIYATRRTQVRHALLSIATGGRIYQNANSVSYIQALTNVSFHIKDGDRLALIGHNGAGKSTLLKTLAGLLPPAAGTMKIEGDISVLFNLSNGLDIEKTGYENIVGMGLILGMKKKDIASIVPDVEAFCDLGDFLHLPVRMYSDGMKIRLAFAVSTAIHPEILILDEAIGAGDAHFIKKATERAHRLYNKARIIVMASHSPDILRDLCNKALLLEKGEVRFQGSVEDALAAYDDLKTRQTGTC